MINVAQHALKTNMCIKNRCGLYLNLDPKLTHNDNDEILFGVLFVHGCRFNGCHVRFNDISSDGMRLVTPGSLE